MAEPITLDNDLLESIPSIILKDDNKILMAPFMINEVVFSMGPDKAPSSDGFTTLFYQKYWEFVGIDLLLALEESKRNRVILKELNSTLITIIPKMVNPKSFADFHPIALCNTLYKIFTKAISIRLAKLIPRIISIEHEILHSIVSQKNSAMILKLDMMKAYDRVDWNALTLVLSKFGFGKSWIKWIYACISLARFLVLINGSPCGFFSSSQSVRQGDPLSPFLFIILAEAFSRAIRSVRSYGLWQGVHVANLRESFSYCLFADDTMLFGYPSMEEAKVIRKNNF